MTTPIPDGEGLPPFTTYRDDLDRSAAERFRERAAIVGPDHEAPQAPAPRPAPGLPLVVLLGDRQVGTATNDGGVLTMTITDPLASAALRGSVAGLSVAFDLSGGER